MTCVARARARSERTFVRDGLVGWTQMGAPTVLYLACIRQVCIFNFVTDSPGGRGLWNVLSGATEFDMHKHLLLAEELKALYVALTRARKRCFIFDSDVPCRTPLFDALSARGVAEKGAEQQLSVKATAAGRSTTQDWLLRGENLFQNKLWAHAEKCFLRGCDRDHCGDHTRPPLPPATTAGHCLPPAITLSLSDARAGSSPWRAYTGARALEAGYRRLVQEALSLEGDERAARYQSAALALVQCAKEHDADSEQYRTSLARAAKAFYLSGTAAREGGESRRRAYCDAGRVLRYALGRPRDAAACYVAAASDAPTVRSLWVDALEASEQCSSISRHLRNRLKWLVDHASTASKEKLVENISALRDELDAARIAWGF